MEQNIRTQRELAKALRNGYSLLYNQRSKAKEVRDEWISTSIKFAVDLHEARNLFKGDIEFGKWIDKLNFRTLSHQDRAALINLAADPNIMRDVLSQTESWAYTTIWSMAKPLYEDLKVYKPRAAQAKADTDRSRRSLTYEESVRKWHIFYALRIVNAMKRALQNIPAPDDFEIDEDPEPNFVLWVKSNPDKARKKMDDLRVLWPAFLDLYQKVKAAMIQLEDEVGVDYIKKESDDDQGEFPF